MEIELNQDSTNFGRIAYHGILFREDGGSDFVQYDFEGKEKYRTEHTPAPLIRTDLPYA